VASGRATPIGPSAPAPDPGARTRPLVLLADDEDAIREELVAFLERAGFDVHAVVDGAQALAAVAAVEPDLCVLDVVMPALDGREVLRRMRAEDRWNPVVLLTRVGQSGERATALDEGADDYLTKPFDPSELAARVRAVLRRAQRGRPSPAASDDLRSGPLRMDRVAHRAWLDDRELVLTGKALLLLDYFLTHADELLTRDRLLGLLWGVDYPTSTRAVDNRVAELRRALHDDPAAPHWIETVQGLGYRFIAPLDAR